MKTHITTLLLITTFCCSLALAEPINAAEKQQPWYQIELLIIEPTNPPLTNEKWPVVVEEASPANMVELSSAGQPGGKSTRANNTPVAFQLLDQKEFELNNIVKKLERAGSHKILMHLAWRQPLDENVTGPAVHIHSNLGKPSKGASGQVATKGNFVDGTVTLTLSRYLHVKTHMIYFNPEVDLGRQIAAHETDTPIVERFLLKESRRVKRKDIHYLDHPYFGMIVKVTRYEDGKSQ